MGELKSKRPLRRVKKDAGSPLPTGPIGGSEIDEPRCGHSSCGSSCQVRYVGPTSHLRDHHIVHAARGVTHVWTAAIVAGLAVVLTGAIAYSSVDAKSVSSPSSVTQELVRLNKRIDVLSEMLMKLTQQCNVSSQQCRDAQDTSESTEAQDENVTVTTDPSSDGSQQTTAGVECQKKCSADVVSCLRTVSADSGVTRENCVAAYKTCQTSCAPAAEAGSGTAGTSDATGQ